MWDAGVTVQYSAGRCAATIWSAPSTASRGCARGRGPAVGLHVVCAASRGRARGRGPVAGLHVVCAASRGRARGRGPVAGLHVVCAVLPQCSDELRDELLVSASEGLLRVIGNEWVVEQAEVVDSVSERRR